MVEFTRCTRTGEQTIRLEPNRSLTRRSAAVIFLGLAGGCLLFSALLAVQGYWLPLPFAGLEVLALGSALYWVRRELRVAEEIAIGSEGVLVRRRHHRGDSEASFSRAWVQVVLKPGRHRWYPRRLVLRSHGRELEIGAFLAEPERSRLARRLRDQLRRPDWTPAHDGARG